MKKLIIMLIPSLMIALGGISQTSNDTVCIPVKQAIKAINIIEKCKITQQELEITKEALSLANSRLSIKDSIISSQIKNIELYKQVSMIDNKQITNLERSLKVTTRKYKNQKFLKWAGIFSSFFVGFIIAKH